MENISIKLRVANKGLTQVVDYVQGTNTIPIVFDIVDYNIPAGATANIYIKKPSGAQIYNSCSISGNEITVNPTTQMFAESGKQFGQLQILNSEKILESFLILFNVEKSIVDDTAIESSDEFTALEDALNSIDDSATEAKNAVSAANQAVSDAQIAIENANTAISGANAAASSANSAAESATNAASTANTAAGTANTAAQTANAAASNADEKASAANTAATNAQNIADEVEQKLENGDFAATVSAGTVTTGAAGTSAIVTNSGTQNDAVFDFTIPQGAQGVPGTAATITVGTVTTGEPDTNASVTNVGTENAAVLNFTIPRGETGQLENIEDQPINFTESQTDTDIASGDMLKTLFGKLLKNIKTLRSTKADASDLTSHVENENNPHSVTKSQIGLGNVDNTSDADKPISTATHNALNGKANSSHDHDASDITSGTLPLARGGTGQTSLSGVKSAFGITTLENNFANLLDSDTIQAAENAGILSGEGLTLLNEILQLCLANAPVEVGTEGIWTYVKYADGRAECYGQQNINWGSGVAWMGGYYHTQIGTTAFPSGLFAAPPVLNSFTIGAVIGAVVGQSIITKDKVAIIMLNGSAGGSTQAYPVGFIAKGKWK